MLACRPRKCYSRNAGHHIAHAGPCLPCAAGSESVTFSDMKEALREQVVNFTADAKTRKKCLGGDHVSIDTDAIDEEVQPVLESHFLKKLTEYKIKGSTRAPGVVMLGATHEVSSVPSLAAFKAFLLHNCGPYCS